MPLSKIKKIEIVPRYASDGTTVPNVIVMSQAGVAASVMGMADKIITAESLTRLSRSIEKRIVGMSVNDLSAIDNELSVLKGDSSVIMSTSMAVARLAAKVSHRELYQQLRDECSFVGYGRKNFGLLVTLLESDTQRLFAVIPNGVKHALVTEQVTKAIDLQLLLGKKIQTIRQVGVGVHGGYKVESVIDSRLWQLVRLSLDKSGLNKVVLGLDINANEHYDDVGKRYRLGNEASMTRIELAAWMRMVGRQYNIQMFIDPLSKKDWKYWSDLRQELNNAQIMVGLRSLSGSDQRLAQAHHASALDVASCRTSDAKTVSGLLHFLMQSRHYGLSRMCSISASESEESFLVDVALGIGAEFIDIGGALGSEHSAKYNRLLTIADQENL